MLRHFIKGVIYNTADYSLNYCGKQIRIEVNIVFHRCDIVVAAYKYLITQQHDIGNRNALITQLNVRI